MDSEKEGERRKMADRYYIAYGSNLSVDQMAVRTPDAVIAGTGIIKDWRLLFRQFATIEKCKGYSVPVLIWKISKRDEKSLDRYEGFPRFYSKKNLTVAVTSLNGQDLGEFNAMVYIMTQEATHMRSVIPLPSKHYYSVLYAGYKMFGFDESLLEDAVIEAVEHFKSFLG